MSIANITFIDVETVPQHPKMDYSEELEQLFRKRFLKDSQEIPIHELWNEKSSLHAEFGKVVCISIGKMSQDKFYIKTIASRKEDELLKLASESIQKANGTLCAHNGLEFDFPFLMRRYMINGLPVPTPLNVAGVKPWDIKLEDTMKMWSGTQWAYKVSLELLCHLFGLPSPKKGMNGASIAEIYFDSFNVEKDELPFEKEVAALKKIGDYCNGDVLALANVYCKMKGFPIITDDQIVYV